MALISCQKIIAVYGFLGSGKTTVMMALARDIVAGGHRAAVVVNEAGDVPVDGKWLMTSGLPVKEIFGGCICCSVVGDFITTLRALTKEPSLDTILIEPSGMADAPQLFGSIEKHIGLPVLKVLVLDAPRLSLLLKAAAQLIRGQLEAADIILLNKTDALTPDQLSETRHMIPRQKNIPAILDTAAANGLPVALIEDILK